MMKNPRMHLIQSLTASTLTSVVILALSSAIWAVFLWFAWNGIAPLLHWRSLSLLQVFQIVVLAFAVRDFLIGPFVTRQ